MTKHFIPRVSWVLALLLSLAVAPQLPANDSAATEATAAGLDDCTAPEAALALAETELPPFAVEGLFADSGSSNASGCSAMQYCVHGGSVSCSAPSGTCENSSQRCGRVTCNGETTWCPGACYAGYHCFSFCNGSFDAYCDDGCCVCP